MMLMVVVVVVVVVEGSSRSHNEDIAKAHHAYIWREVVVDGPG
jgi:hypothetical protein